MKVDLFVAVFLALALHGGLALSGHFMRKSPAPTPEPEKPGVVELVTLPPVEPEPVDVVEAPGESAGDISEIAPPSLADTPSATIDSSFVQQIQPPQPPGLTKPTGAITIPVGRPSTGGGAGSGLGTVFDLASLDQAPVPRFRAPPDYPSEMRRAGISGQVIVEFIVDAQGNVRDAFAHSSTHRDFEPAAIAAVMKWKFRPGKKGGVAQNARMRVPVSFTLAAQ